MPEKNPAKRPSRRRIFIGLGIGTGCLAAACLALVLLLALGGKVRRDISEGAQALGRAIEMANIGQMMLDAGVQEDEAMAALEVFSQAFNSDISETQRSKLAAGVAAIVLARGAQINYLPGSGLSEAEEREGTLTAARFARSAAVCEVVEKEIWRMTEIAAATEADIPLDADGYEINRVLKPSLTDVQLRDLLAKMKTTADKCGVGEVPPGIDLKSEIARVIEQVCGARPKEEAPAP